MTGPAPLARGGGWLSRVARAWLPLACLCLGFATGCVSRKEAALQQEHAYAQGRQQALVFQQTQPAPRQVFFRGAIRKPILEWSEGMTLAEGILEAEYSGRRAPRHVQIRSWQGELIEVDARTLLDGDDYLLEAGDIVEVRR